MFRYLISLPYYIFFSLFTGLFFTAQAAGLVDLTISKSGPSNALAGETITYQFTIANNGPDAADGAIFNDVIPTGLTINSTDCISATGGAVCPANFNTTGNTVSATIPTFPQSGALQFNIQVTIPYNSATSYSNTATITPPAGVTESNQSSNTSTIGTSVRRLTVDVFSTITGPNTWNIGDQLTYTVVYGNNGPDTITNSNRSLSINNTDLLINLNFDGGSCVAFNGATCPANAATSTSGILPPIPPGGRLEFSYSFTVQASTRCSATAVPSTAFALNNQIGVPSGVNDTNTGNNASNILGISGISNNPRCPAIRVTKTGPNSLDFSGGEQTYVITLENIGSGAADGWKFSDNVLTYANYFAFNVRLNPQRYECVAENGAVCPNIVLQNPQVNGSNTFIGETTINTWPETGKITLTIYIRPSIISPLPCGDPAQDIRVNNNITLRDVYLRNANPAPGSAPVTEAHNITIGVQPCPRADLKVERTGPSRISMSDPLEPYSITISNLGPDAANGASFDEVLSSPSFAALFNNMSISCTATNGAVCPAGLPTTPNTSPAIRLLGFSPIPVLPAGGTITYTFSGANFMLQGNVCPRDSLSLNFSASVTAPIGVTEVDNSNNRASSTPVTIFCSVLSVNKQASNSSLVVGDSITYFIDVNNGSPSADAAGRVVSDALPRTFNYDPATPATCVTASGSAICGDITYDPITHTISSIINAMPAGSGIRFTIPGTIAQPGSWSNTASVNVIGDNFTSPLPGSASSTINVLAPGVDLGIEKQGPAGYLPGESINYTLIVTNYGNAISNAIITDNIPAAITNVSWSCNGIGGASCSTSTGSGNTINIMGNFPQGGSNSGRLILTIQGTVDAAATGTIENIAQVEPPVGIIDLVPDNNLASISSTQIIPPAADLSVSKFADITHYIPATNNAVTYTITVQNHGPDHVTNATLSDLAPTNLTINSWHCDATADAICHQTTGISSIQDVAFDINVGSQVTFTVEATINSTASGTIENVATVSNPLNDPDMRNNVASAKVEPGLSPNEVDLSITKTVSPQQYTIGTPTALTYSIIVENLGTTIASNADVIDTPPTGITLLRWDCVATGGSCSASGDPALTNGQLQDSVTLTPGGKAVYTVSAHIESTAISSLENIARVTPDAGITIVNPLTSESRSVVSPTGTPLSDLSITLNASPASYSPGQLTDIQYTARVNNHGPSPVSAATLTSMIDAGITINNWSCSATGGAACSVITGSGTAELQNILLDMPVNSEIIFNINGSIAADVLGSKSYGLTINVPLGTVDPFMNNNTDEAITSQGTIQTDVAVFKSASKDTYQPGVNNAVVYTINMENLSAFSVNGLEVTDLLPNEVSILDWECFITNGMGSCPPAGGAVAGGNTLRILFDLGANSRAQLIINANVISNANTSTLLTNTVELTVPNGFNDTDLTNNISTFTLTPVPVNSLPEIIRNIPVLVPVLLLLITLSLGVIALWHRHKHTS